MVAGATVLLGVIPSAASGDGPKMVVGAAPTPTLAAKSPVAIVAGPKLSFTAAERKAVTDALTVAAASYAKDKKPATMLGGGRALGSNAARLYRLKAETIVAAAQAASKVKAQAPMQFDARYAIEAGQVASFTQTNCDVSIQVDLTLKNRGANFPAEAPQPSLSMFSASAWWAGDVSLPRLASAAIGIVRIGPITWNLGSDAPGKCRDLNLTVDLTPLRVKTVAIYELTVRPGQAFITATPPGDPGPFDDLGCEWGTCANGKCMVPSFGCDY